MIDMPPGWVPNDNASVDPHLECDLKEIKEHPPTQQEYMPRIVEKLKECYDPEISVDIYNLGLIYDVKVTEDGYVHVLMSLTSGEHTKFKMQGQDNHATTVGSRHDQS
jgi:metal-sulfur cluster biosynthetic enzyme